MGFRQIKAIEASNKKRLIKHFGNIPDTSGIYILTRFEKGFKYAYIGQAKRILTRMAQHLVGYQHIDLSIKKHGLYTEENMTGWYFSYVDLPERRLDEAEQEFIKDYADKGYQLRNKTVGGQGKGKTKLNDFKPARGYNDGLKQGKKKLREELNYIIDSYLDINLIKNNKLSQNALEKFNKLLGRNKNEL